MSFDILDLTIAASLAAVVFSFLAVRNVIKTERSFKRQQEIHEARRRRLEGNLR